MEARKISIKNAYAMVLAQSIVFGIGDPISKIAYEVMPVYSLLTARFLISFLIIMLFAGKSVLRGLRKSRVRDWILPAICTACSYLCGNIALDYTAATSVAFLRSMSILMTPILALILFRRAFRKAHVPFLLLVVLGLYLLCVRGGLSGFGRGEIFALLAALFMAGSLVFGERSLQNVDPLMLTAMQCALSVVLDAGCAFWLDGGLHYAQVTWQPFLILLYLAVICTVLGYWLQNKALTAISPRAVALWQCICPVMTAIFSRIILGETMTTLGILGACIILVCVAAETGIRE